MRKGVVAIVLAATFGQAMAHVARVTPALGFALGVRAGVVAADRSFTAKRHGARCRPGTVHLALIGSRHVVSLDPMSYTVLAGACAGRRTRASLHIRLSLRGPQSFSWTIKHLRQRSAVRRKVKLTFPRPKSPAASGSTVLTLEARTRRGRLLGRLQVRVYYSGGPPVEAPHPLGFALVGWGTNMRGELGAAYRSQPVTGPLGGVLAGVRQAVSAYGSGYALMSDGTIRAWGGNEVGQLGDGTRIEKINPVPVHGLSHVAQIAASGAHVMALLEDGSVWAWGSNFWGDLGNGTRDAVEGMAHPLPMPVPGLKSVVGIYAGGGDDAARLANGTVLAWGENSSGQLGDGTKQTKLVPTPVHGLSGVRELALGGISSLGGHMLALLGNGTVMVGGANDHGQLGLGDTSARLVPVPLPGLSGVTAVSASESHSLAIVSGGSVLSWGAGADGELGYRATETCGGAPCGTVPRRVAISNVTAVSAGFRFSVALSEERVFTWGVNDKGQLGDGTTTPSTSPVRIGGIAGVQSISASEKFTLGTALAVPAPDFSLTPMPGKLLAHWSAAPGPESWSLTWRPFTRPLSTWSHQIVLPASTLSYVIAGLSPGMYEVRLKRLNSSFGSQIAYGEAL